MTNASFNEVLFFTPSSNATENDSYVSWNWISNTWSIGSLGRTAGIDTGTFNLPLYMTSEFIFKLSGNITGTISVDDTLTGGTSNATAKVLAIDTSGDKPLIKVSILSGTFQAEAISNGSGGSGTIASFWSFSARA